MAPLRRSKGAARGSERCALVFIILPRHLTLFAEKEQNISKRKATMLHTAGLPRISAQTQTRNREETNQNIWYNSFHLLIIITTDPLVHKCFTLNLQPVSSLSLDGGKSGETDK